MSFDNLIIGNSAAAVGAVEAIRRSRNDDTIGIISEDDGPPYSKPFIGELVSGKSAGEDIWYRPKSFYRENSVELIAGSKATSLDLSSRRVLLENGDSYGFAKLLIATGGRPIVPPIPGLASCCQTFTTLKDATEIKETIEHDSPSSAVVLGGGLIGVSAAESFLERGLHTTIIELAPRLMSSALDEDSSELIEKMFKRKGAEIITGHTISRCESDIGDIALTLDDERKLRCELLVVAIGVRPRTELADETEILVDRGILVNRSMETSVEGVYAAGDCAQIYDFISQENRVLAMWPTAYVGGMTAGYNMAGITVESEWATSMNSTHFFGTPLLSAGVAQAGEGPEWDQHSVFDDGHYAKVITRRGEIAGFILLGDVGNAGILLQLMRRRIPLDKLGKSPIDGQFGLAHLPPRVRGRLWKEGDRIVGP